ncbi:Retrovirus-related Pol polyprotein from transposon TNT 1-94, partial [Stegodyphus mimosarum]
MLSIADENLIKQSEDNLRFVDGRYETCLLWGIKPTDLKSNFCLARKGLDALKNNFVNNEWFANEYKDIIKEQQSKSIIEEYSRDAKEYFMPHRAVVRTDKDTTKVRVVFNCSSKAKLNISLNDYLKTAPNLNPNVLDVILNFKKFKIAFCADIEKAFLMIGIAAEDMKFLKFLWLSENTNEDYKIMRMTRLPFGYGQLWRRHVDQMRDGGTIIDNGFIRPPPALAISKEADKNGVPEPSKYNSYRTDESISSSKYMVLREVPSVGPAAVYQVTIETNCATIFAKENELIVGVYVDDLLVMSSEVSIIQKFKDNIAATFKIKDLGEIYHLLLIRISRTDDGSMTLDQSVYAGELLETTDMLYAKGASTPLELDIKYTSALKDYTLKAERALKYRQAVGGLLYLTGGTRPDLVFALTYLNQFNNCTRKKRWIDIHHILRYLKQAKELKPSFQDWKGFGSVL